MDEIIRTSEEMGKINEQAIKIANSRNSYMKKQDLIDMITKLNFDAVKEIKLECITSYEYIPGDDEHDSRVKTYGFDINIY